MEDDFDYQRAAYRSGMEAASEGDAIDANPFDQEAETAEWLSWRRGLDKGKRLEEAKSRAAFDRLCGRVPTLLTRS